VRNESVVLAADGSVYVSHVGGGGIKHYDAGGTLLQTLAPGQRTHWMDLAADQRTMFYSDEGPTIHRWDVQANVPLPDFATLPSGEGFALRLPPTADGSSDLLVADFDDVLRLDSAGNIVQTYNSPVPESTWFAVNLDPDGTSFWSGAPGSGNLCRFNVASGNVELGPINTGHRHPGGYLPQRRANRRNLGRYIDHQGRYAGPGERRRRAHLHAGVSNAGPNDATGVAVKDQLPAGTTFISATSTQGNCGLAVGTVTCSPGTVPTAGLVEDLRACRTHCPAP
jgi:streptogramin lyase